mgnify:CR=1 FL=1
MDTPILKKNTVTNSYEQELWNKTGNIMNETTSTIAIQNEIKAAQSKKQTAFLLFGDEAKNLGFESEYYFIEGNEVSKESFILNSGMEHLLLNQSVVKCTQCGRNEKPELYKKPVDLDSQKKPVTASSSKHHTFNIKKKWGNYYRPILQSTLDILHTTPITIIAITYDKAVTATVYCTAEISKPKGELKPLTLSIT